MNDHEQARKAGKIKNDPEQAKKTRKTIVRQNPASSTVKILRNPLDSPPHGTRLALITARWAIGERSIERL